MDPSDGDIMVATDCILASVEDAEAELRSLSACLADAGFPHRIQLDDPQDNPYAEIEHAWSFVLPDDWGDDSDAELPPEGPTPSRVFEFLSATRAFATGLSPIGWRPLHLRRPVVLHSYILALFFGALFWFLSGPAAGAVAALVVLFAPLLGAAILIAFDDLWGPVVERASVFLPRSPRLRRATNFLLFLLVSLALYLALSRCGAFPS